MHRTNDSTIEFFKIILADKKIEIECNYRTVFYMCRDYLADFDDPDFIIRVSEEEIYDESSRLPKITTPYPGIAARHAYEYIENRLVYNKIAEALIHCGILLMHGSVISTDGQGYMFIAPSGAGKTTRTKIWKDLYPESVVINGDKPLIKISDNEIIAYGTPWCGKEEWNTNGMVPLKAVFLLERADNDGIDYLEEINAGKAFPFLLRHTYHQPDPDLQRKTIKLLKGFENNVKIYKFHSTPTPQSVRLAYETARKQ